MPGVTTPGGRPQSFVDAARDVVATHREQSTDVVDVVSATGDGHERGVAGDGIDLLMREESLRLVDDVLRRRTRTRGVDQSQAHRFGHPIGVVVGAAEADVQSRRYGVWTRGVRTSERHIRRRCLSGGTDGRLDGRPMRRAVSADAGHDHCRGSEKCTGGNTHAAEQASRHACDLPIFLAQTVATTPVAPHDRRSAIDRVQRLRKSGSRLATNAAMPSVWSSVANVE